MHSDWLYELLEPVVDEIVVVVPDKQRGAKSDSADAWARADELRGGAIVRAVYKAPRRFTVLRQAVRAHRMTLEDLVRSKNRWRALLRLRAVQVEGEAVYEPANRKRLLSKLPVSHRAAAAASAVVERKMPSWSNRAGLRASLTRSRMRWSYARRKGRFGTGRGWTAGGAGASEQG